jgi:hypothetical protein
MSENGRDWLRALAFGIPIATLLILACILLAPVFPNKSGAACDPVTLGCAPPPTDRR